MIIKVDKNELESLKKVCALASVKVTIFTMEENDLMVAVELTELDGRELPSKDTWHICRSFCSELEIKELHA